MRSDHWLLIFVFCNSLIVVNATISQSFYQHIQEKYGEATAKLVARTDFGASGSYGGGNHQSGTKTKYI